MRRLVRLWGSVIRRGRLCGEVEGVVKLGDRFWPLCGLVFWPKSMLLVHICVVELQDMIVSSRYALECSQHGQNQHHCETSNPATSCPIGRPVGFHADGPSQIADDLDPGVPASPSSILMSRVVKR
jgi:hypothetical protein